ncbi:hypothetical protein J7E70_07885 [Variovorax paradoxus]|nr:hypothetical protein [Variovorax paradoxus]MBT2300383.1 hypothetical protein [Variovorax paradoxus]
MNVEDAKMQCLAMSGGNVAHAQKMLEWIYPAPSERELCQAMTVGRIGTPVSLTDMDGVRWYYAGEPDGWKKLD